MAREKALANAKIKDETEKLSNREKVVKKEKTIQSSPDTVDPANIPAKKDPELLKENAKNIKSESATSKKKDLKKNEKERRRD